jgi:hypothetical protein
MLRRFDGRQPGAPSYVNLKRSKSDANDAGRNLRGGDAAIDVGHLQGWIAFAIVCVVFAK